MSKCHNDQAGNGQAHSADHSRSHPGANGKGPDGNDKAVGELLSFPCRYEIKAMGRDNFRFSALVQSIVTRHVGAADFLGVRARSSRQGTYVSVSCTIMARDRGQLHAIYADLRACADVLMTL